MMHWSIQEKRWRSRYKTYAYQDPKQSSIFEFSNEIYRKPRTPIDYKSNTKHNWASYVETIGIAWNLKWNSKLR